MDGYTTLDDPETIACMSGNIAEVERSQVWNHPKHGSIALSSQLPSGDLDGAVRLAMQLPALVAIVTATTIGTSNYDAR